MSASPSKSVRFSSPRASARGLEFGHFHCRVAASERRPAFQGRSRQPNPISRRRATDEIANADGGRDSSAADAARLPDGAQGTGLERPAYCQAPRCGGETGVSVPSKSHLSVKCVFHGRNFVTAGISQYASWSGPDPKCPNSRYRRRRHGWLPRQLQILD